eukprot:m.7093 g.7093  ORF g.7093 m.7093 type:complete len:73 (+) comp2705_c0_seq1:1057-1275(+)
MTVSFSSTRSLNPVKLMNAMNRNCNAMRKQEQGYEENAYNQKNWKQQLETTAQKKQKQKINKKISTITPTTT